MIMVRAVSMDVQDRGLNPQEEAIKSQKVELMQMFVTKLPARYQRLVRLRYFDELSYEEIAKELDAPVGTVKAQLHRARDVEMDV
jgi:RNA polymerase sigma-70 factor (ECF subfamily)